VSVAECWLGFAPPRTLCLGGKAVLVRFAGVCGPYKARQNNALVIP